ncbi:hypothetical protein, partial [Mycolicibacter algericus]
MQISAASTALTIARSAKKLDVELPADYLDALAHAEEVAAVVATIYRSTPVALHHAVLDAISAGRDHTTDPLVLRHLVGQQIAASGIESTARARADSDLRAL